MSSIRPQGQLALFYFAYFALVGVLLPYWSLYLESLGYSAGEIALIAALLMGTRVGAPNIWGWLADRYHNRLPLIRWGCFLALFSFACLTLSTDFVWMALVIFAFSFFWNAVLAQFEVLTLQHLFPHTGHYGRVRIWGSLGFIVAVLGLGYLLPVVSVNWVPWSAALLLVLLWFAALWVPAPADLPVHSSAPAGPAFRNPQLWLFMWVVLLVQLAHGPYYTFFSLYLKQAGWPETTIGILWSLGVVAEILLFMVSAKILVRFPLHRLLMLAVGLSALRWGLIGVGAERLWLLLLAQCLHAASFGLSHAVAIEWVRRSVPANQAGQGQALYSSVSFGLGGALGAVGSGLIWNWSQVGTFYIAGIICVIAWFFMPKLREPTK